MKRKKVAVAPEREFQARRRLFSLLGELYPADFEAWRPGGTLACDAVIFWEGCAEEKEIMAGQSADCLVVAQAEGPAIPVVRREVKFTLTPALDSCFRGRTMVEECVESFPALRPRNGDELVCSLESQPYWLVRQNGRARNSVVALAPEEMAEGQTVYYHYNRRRWLRSLPFFHFVKQLTADIAWTPPPLRACLMFDDPNLHWPTYGFIDFREMARHARELNYHATFAMVPLNTGYVGSSVAEFFRQNRERISLCMHGNNHDHAELAAALDSTSFTQLLAQGLRRIDSFEKRSGVPVSRVMVPPNGAFGEHVADPLLNLGYEAVCVSRSSLTGWNKQKEWATSFGHPVTEFMGAGLPVIPRQVMAPGHEGTYRLAAFLNQPILPHAHHQDCAGGLDLLACAATSINDIGGVTWMDMASISRSNYLTKRESETLTVKMLSRRITMPVADGVKQVVVERPWISGEAEGELLEAMAGGQTCFSGKFGGQSKPLQVPARGVLELRSPSPKAVNHREVTPPNLKIWSLARRWLSEARDRVAPLKSHVRPHRAKHGTPALSQKSAG